MSCSKILNVVKIVSRRSRDHSCPGISSQLHTETTYPTCSGMHQHCLFWFDMQLAKKGLIGS